ncbi:putative pyroglutamyl peptidase type I [Lasiosphaeris hirsuta]|uniref:Pyroglutamyl peptidase type I n=1 Tax=Lasiosphaeris hirsuta TaxID=260670 RepID=A0AA40BBE0_9PEZI|nr:putative pyroglutamyl peptidase type I [Lasiosphaeris hirsuta]
MGSTDTAQEELTILITGFGPFKKEYPINPSWEIARGLPEYLPKATRAGAKLPRVRLLVHPEPIRVTYQVVRETVPQLWNLNGEAGEPDRPKIDLAIHIGMAGPKPVYSIERRGHREGYAMKDVDGEFLKDQERKTREGKKWVWDGVPKELETDFDLDDVLVRWKKNSPPQHDLRISEDAGNFLCDFIYFSSLAHLFKAGELRKVVFLHVPSESSGDFFAVGKELVLQLVRSIVESELTRQGKF